MHAQRTALAAITFLPAAALALTDTGAPTWVLCLAGVVVGLFVGANLGVGLMCLLQINREPSAPEETP